MKKIFLFAVITSLLFAVSCEKKELTPKKEKTGIEKLKEITGAQGQFVKKTDKSSNPWGVEGDFYIYYPNEENSNTKQDIFITDKNNGGTINAINPFTYHAVHSYSNQVLGCWGAGSTCASAPYQDGVVIIVFR